MQMTSKRDIASLGTIMSVWAHPDDETFTAGGIMRIASQNKQDVICLTATKGELGTRNEQLWPEALLADIRSRELMDALSIIGVKTHHWLDYVDGQCRDVDSNKASSKIANYIDQYRPDTILTFGPEGLTGHPDHQAVSQWVTKAVAMSTVHPAIYHAVITIDQYEKYLQLADQKLDIFYNIDQPPLVDRRDCDLCLHCDESTCNCKHDALVAMPSQMTDLKEQFGSDFIKDAFRVEAFIRMRE